MKQIKSEKWFQDNKKLKDDKLIALFKEALEKIKTMTPEEYQDMLQKQRESWARQDMD